MEFNFPSKVLFKAIESFNSLPGVGRKTALRYTLNMLKMEPAEIIRFSENIRKLAEDIRFCEKCHNISDQIVCDICSNTSRKRDTLCVVQNVRDVLAIENTTSTQALVSAIRAAVGDDVLTEARDFKAAMKKVDDQIADVFKQATNYANRLGYCFVAYNPNNQNGPGVVTPWAAHVSDANPDPGDSSIGRPARPFPWESASNDSYDVDPSAVDENGNPI